MATFNIYKGTELTTTKVPIKDGQLLFETDTKKIWLDSETQRLQMGGQDTIKHKNGTPDEWSQATDFSPLKGELVVYNDTTNPRMKVGDGETNVNDLPFINNAFVTVNLDGAGDGEDFIPDDNLVINAETLGGKPASSYMLKTDTATNSNNLGNQPPDYYAKQSDLTSLIGSNSQTAKNADKLGGKPPEAYTAVNLLANSYWRIRKNIINQRGQTVYNGSGYTIDLWQCGNAAGKVELVDGGIAFSATGGGDCYFIQVVPSEIAEKLSDTTKAVKLTNGTIYAGTTTTVAIPNGSISFFQASSGKWLYQIAVTPYSTVTLEWAAFFEGVYDDKTLPPFVPTHPRVENLKIGNAIQPTNLLDNPDFAVAQAGYPVWDSENNKWISGMHGAALYFADRWCSSGANSGFTVERNNDVLSVDNTVSQTCKFVQHLSDDVINRIIGKSYTIAVCMDDGTIVTSTAIFNYQEGVVYDGPQMRVPGGFRVNLYQDRVEPRPNVRFFATDVATLRVKWIALYEGSYTADTLPPYVPKGYAVELAECQRYYLPIEYGPCSAGYIDNTDSTMYITVPVPVKMRILPSITYNNAYGTLAIYTTNGKSSRDIARIVATVNSSNFIQLKIVFNDALSCANKPCFVEAYDSLINMALSADL